MGLTDKECTVCKNKFSVDDDIVVCPECGAPYHRECFEKIGKCVNTDNHEEMKKQELLNAQKEEQEQEQEQNTEDNSGSNSMNKKICVVCETKTDLNTKTCPNCGSTVFYNEGNINPALIAKMFGVDPNYEYEENITGKDVASFTALNGPYYLNVFKSIKEKNKSRFNGSAFIFGGSWYFYRKQFLWGIIFFLITIAIIIFWFFLSNDVSNILESLILAQTGKDLKNIDYATLSKILPDIFNALDDAQKFKFLLNESVPFIFLIEHFISGIIANRIYYKNSIKKIKKIKSKAANESALLDFYRSEGGVSLAYALWYLMIVNCCLFFL